MPYSLRSWRPWRLRFRDQAARSITLESFAKKMTGIVADRTSDFLDEAPHTYKDLDTVLGHQSDLVTPIQRLLPLLNVKGAGKWQRTPAHSAVSPERPAVRKDRTRDKDDPVQRRRLARRGRG